MEVEAVATGFSCGRCVFLLKNSGTCDNPKVRAPVSPDHGCCNLFWPADQRVVFPPKR